MQNAANHFFRLILNGYAWVVFMIPLEWSNGHSSRDQRHSRHSQGFHDVIAPVLDFDADSNRTSTFTTLELPDSRSAVCLLRTPQTWPR